MKKSTRLKRRLGYIYNEKLNEEGRYYADWFIYIFANIYIKIFDFLVWLFKHEKLTYIASFIFATVLGIILITACFYAFAGFISFLEMIGHNELANKILEFMISVFNTGLYD